MIDLLLDRGADIDALHGQSPVSERGYAARDFQPIDLALWTGPFWGVRGDVEVELLFAYGADPNSLHSIIQVYRALQTRSDGAQYSSLAVASQAGPFGIVHLYRAGNGDHT